MNDNIEINKMCRLCLTKEEVNVNIFEGKGDEEQLDFKISTCLPIQISRNDCFPNKICNDCSDKVNSMFLFWNTSVSSEKTLLKWFLQCGGSNQNSDTQIAELTSSDMKIDVKDEEVTDFLPNESLEEVALSNFVADYGGIKQEIIEFPLDEKLPCITDVGASEIMDTALCRIDSSDNPLAQQNVFSHQKNIKMCGQEKLMVNLSMQAKITKLKTELHAVPDPFFDENNAVDNYSGTSSGWSSSPSDDETYYVPKTDGGSNSTSPNGGSLSTNDAIILARPLNKGTKRQRNDKQWKKNILKEFRNSGKAYEMHSMKKKIRNERKMKPTCTDKCRLKCSTKFSEEERNKFFTAYWNLADVEQQRTFILNSMNTICPKYRYVRLGGLRNQRQNNNAFYLCKNDKQVRVCKLFYKNTLDINDRPIRTVLSKLNKIPGVLLEPDMRGKHGKHKKAKRISGKA